MNIKKIAKVAAMLQEKKLYKESFTVDLVLHKLASGGDDVDLVALEESLDSTPSFSPKIRDISNKILTFFRENTKEESTIVSQLGKFSAPNKPTLKTFIRALQTLEKRGVSFSGKDNQLLLSVQEMVQD